VPACEPAPGERRKESARALLQYPRSKPDRRRTVIGGSIHQSSCQSMQVIDPGRSQGGKLRRGFWESMGRRFPGQAPVAEEKLGVFGSNDINTISWGRSASFYARYWGVHMRNTPCCNNPFVFTASERVLRVCTPMCYTP